MIKIIGYFNNVDFQENIWILAGGVLLFFCLTYQINKWVKLPAANVENIYDWYLKYSFTEFHIRVGI